MLGVLLQHRKLLHPKSSNKKDSLRVIVGGSLPGAVEISGPSDKVEVTRRMTEEDDTLDKLYVFAAEISLDPLRGHGVTPMFCLDEPEIIKEGDKTTYIGFYPRLRGNGYISLDCGIDWSRNITVKEDGSGYVYHGQGVHGEVVFFNEKVLYDKDKRFLLVRSPNASVDFSEDSLAEVDFSEGRDTLNCIRSSKYKIVYTNIEKMVEGNAWAFNNPGSGIKYKDNLDLFLNLRVRE